jgi:hypothetical protein
MAEWPPLLHVAMDEEADHPFQAAVENRLLLDEKRDFPCPPGTAEGRSRVQGIDVRGNGKEKGYDILPGKLIFLKKPVIAEGGPANNIFLVIAALKGPSQGAKLFHGIFPPVNAKMKAMPVAITKPRIARPV